jgi:hypothetical protein
MALWDDDASHDGSAGGAYVTYEWLERDARNADGGGGGRLVRLYTSSSPELPQCMAYMDTFQAYDRRTAAAGDPALAAALHAALCDRNNGGAFDVLRTYGNLSALCSTMLGWRGSVGAERAAEAADGSDAGARERVCACVWV